jgi:GTP-binding nuclear protein Ran
MEYTLALVGESKVGKTSFIKRHLSGDFTDNYLKTTEVQRYILRLNTSKGEIKFNILDIPKGSELFVDFIINIAI